ncbi:MAG: hypothetical protein OHK0019_14950 [Saprospiraceae bacterium]
MLDDIANLLEIQHANPFKVKAYRTGAKYVRERSTPLANLVKSGDGEALQALPGIGESLGISVNVFGSLKDALAPPLLFLPLVENAFKFPSGGCIKTGWSVSGDKADLKSYHTIRSP